MLRTLRATVVAAVVGLTLTVAAPAEAHTNVCIGTGRLTTTQPMYFVGFGTPAFTSFVMTFPIPPSAQCTTLPMPETFAGEMVGNCGLATGTGSTASGHAFTVTWQGGTLTFNGQVQGQLGIKEDPTTGDSCVTGAKRFVVAGGLLLSH